ncbi:MAG: hypothetical protein OXJ54_14600 [Gemmatimonadetes bacterium]|nr:hypothetical protein [Candidatus Palauibacter rhopaloidicola]
MSLAVAVRAIDGIALAADTRTTLTSTQKKSSGGGSVTTSYPASDGATKLFQFLGFGVSVVGNPIVAGRSVASLLHELEAEVIKEMADAEQMLTVKEAGERIGNVIRRELAAASEPGDVNIMCSGFDEAGAPTTAKVHVQGDKMTIPADPNTGIGLEAAGDSSVVQALWAMPSVKSMGGTMLQLLPLCDVVDYARFLIETTRDYQRYHLLPQTVGGGVDIAVIERGQGFKWIRRADRLNGGR